MALLASGTVFFRSGLNRSPGDSPAEQEEAAMKHELSRFLPGLLLLAVVLFLAVWIFGDPAQGLLNGPIDDAGETAQAEEGDALISAGEEEGVETEPVGAKPGPETTAPSTRALDALTGRIVDNSGEPVAGATVIHRATWNIDFEARSAADGTFLLEGVPPFRDKKLIVVDGTHAPRLFEVARYDGGALDVGDIRIDDAGSIAGCVLNTSGSPVAGAIVKARPHDNPIRTGPGNFVMVGGEEKNFFRSLETVTDADGAFRIGGLPAGPLALFAFHPQYLIGASRDLAIESEEETSGVLLKLSAGLAIGGSVVGPDRLPVEGALVSVDKSGKKIGPEGYYGTIPESTVRPSICTGEKGFFSVAGLKEGGYRMRCAAPGCVTLYLANVPAGAEGVEIRMAPAARLTGRVVDHATGEQLERFTVNVDQPGVDDSDLTVTLNGDSSGGPGTFQVGGLYPGAYGLEVSSEGFMTRTLETRDASPGRRDHVDVRLDRGAILSGRLLHPGGEPAGARLVQIVFPTAGEEKPIAEGKSDADGLFAFTDLPAGIWLVRAFSLYGLPAHDTAVELTAGMTEEGVIVTCQYPATLEGTVFDADRKRAAGETVALVQTQSKLGLSARTGKTGQYTFTHLPPGHYRVILPEQSDESLGVKEVTLEPGKTSTLDLYKPLNGAAEGYVTDQGIAVPSVAINFAYTGTGNRTICKQARPDAHGFYRIELDPGNWRLHADLRAVPRAVKAIQVAGGSTIRVDLSFPTGRVAGRLIDDSTGKPVRSALVSLKSCDASTEKGGYPIRSDGDGFFVIGNVADGMYDLVASRKGFGFAEAVIGTATVIGGGETNVGDLAMRKGFSIRVQVVNARTGRVETPPIVIVMLDTATGEPLWSRKLTSNWTDYYYESALGPGSYRLECDEGKIGGVQPFELTDRNLRDLVLHIGPL
jgi:protocatechuate 3,4-dioxygenase beta subunit